ncbi:MAG: 50S ribosomal protein L28 [Candidatus Komeilibacteria bacterium]|nr:50S ribosomal protein L28 [Candidatus Komeilibacteria bacterium]
MSKVCQISGQRTRVGRNVSHSNRKTKRTLQVNLQNKKLLNPKTGKMIQVKLSTSALKTLSKWQKAGKVYDLAKMLKK